MNRSPVAGTITKMLYRPGQFLAAMRESASTNNEQNIITLATDAGEITFKQIAGLIARRVVCWKKPGERVARGERIGLVRFGSRADLWLPRDSDLLVKIGDNVKGGSSVVAYWPPRAKPTPKNESRSKNEPREVYDGDSSIRLQGTITLDIDPTTGLIAVDSCPVIRTKTFVIGQEPKKYCGPEYHKKSQSSPAAATRPRVPSPQKFK